MTEEVGAPLEQGRGSRPGRSRRIGSRGLGLGLAMIEGGGDVDVAGAGHGEEAMGSAGERREGAQGRREGAHERRCACGFCACMRAVVRS